MHPDPSSTQGAHRARTTEPAALAPAGTRTRRSPGQHSRRQATGTRPRPVVPASVWAPSRPVDPDALWPEPVLEHIVTTLSDRGQAVALLTDRPTSEDPPGPAYGTTARVLMPPGTLAAARELVEAHDRHARIAHWQPRAHSAAAEPFWARFVHPAVPPPDRAHIDDHEALSGLPDDGYPEPPEPVALVIATVDPTGVDDAFGTAAAELLRDGGTLAVITHCDHQQGRLVDPSGSIVASAQNADLLYLQHIVALHHPIATGHLTCGRTAKTDDSRHRRVHSDVYLFGWHGQAIAAASQEQAA